MTSAQSRRWTEKKKGAVEKKGIFRSSVDARPATENVLLANEGLMENSLNYKSPKHAAETYYVTVTMSARER
jgi:hypothetical protein